MRPSVAICCSGSSLEPLGVDPVFEIEPGHPPFPTDLDAGQLTGAQHPRHDERSHPEVLADIGDRQPLFVDSDVDPLHPFRL